MNLTLIQEFDIGCQVNEGPLCERLEMLELCYKEIKRLKNKVSALEEWNKTLERQLRRYERGNVR